jgi:hypothetical protein
MMTSKDIQGNIFLFTCQGAGMNLTTLKNYEVKYEELVGCYYCQLPVCPSRDPGSVPGQFYLEFVVEKVAFGHNFLQVRPFCPFGIIPLMLRTLFFIYQRWYVIVAVDNTTKQRT